MKLHKLIHLLLVVALCGGHLVANIHMMGHLQLPAGHHELSSQSDHHHHSLNFADSMLAHTGEEKNDSEDCGIYHVYQGMGALISMDRADICVPSQSVTLSGAIQTDIASLSEDWHPIRGPPSTT